MKCKFREESTKNEEEQGGERKRGGEEEWEGRDKEEGRQGRRRPERERIRRSLKRGDVVKVPAVPGSARL